MTIHVAELEDSRRSRIRGGLSRNPFNVRDLSPGYCDYVFSANLGREYVLNQLEDHGWSGELCGPHGAGKSTLLATIGKHLCLEGLSTGRIFCHEENSTLPSDWLATLVRCDVLLLDGAEVLPRRQLSVLRFTARILERGLVFTTHATLNHGAHIDVSICPTAFAQIVEERLAQLPVPQQGVIRDLPGYSTPDLLASCEGNGREAILRLYDACERTAAVSHS